MRISVIVPDRLVSVDGVAMRFEGAVPDDSVRTLQYETDALEGSVTFIDHRAEGVKDPAFIAPWVALWTAAADLKQATIAADMDKAAGAFADYQAQQAVALQQVADTAAAAEAAHAESAAKAKAEQDAAIEAQVRAIIAKMGAGGEPA